jgi:hypothetical protein
MMNCSEPEAGRSIPDCHFVQKRLKAARNADREGPEDFAGYEWIRLTLTATGLTVTLIALSHGNRGDSRGQRLHCELVWSIDLPTPSANAHKFQSWGLPQEG